MILVLVKDWTLLLLLKDWTPLVLEDWTPLLHVRADPPVAAILSLIRMIFIAVFLFFQGGISPINQSNLSFFSSAREALVISIIQIYPFSLLSGRH
jgi:hypothetical protein